MCDCYWWCCAHKTKDEIQKLCSKQNGESRKKTLETAHTQKSAHRTIDEEKIKNIWAVGSRIVFRTIIHWHWMLCGWLTFLHGRNIYSVFVIVVDDVDAIALLALAYARSLQIHVSNSVCTVYCWILSAMHRRFMSTNSYDIPEHIWNGDKSAKIVFAFEHEFLLVFS